MTDWKPIETAPKDGTVVIGWAAGWRSVQAISLERTNCGGEEWFNTKDGFTYVEPTHWVDEPTPPG